MKIIHWKVAVFERYRVFNGQWRVPSEDSIRPADSKLRPADSKLRPADSKLGFSANNLLVFWLNVIYQNTLKNSWAPLKSLIIKVESDKQSRQGQEIEFNVRTG